jgi:hypothetical protein
LSLAGADEGLALEVVSILDRRALVGVQRGDLEVLTTRQDRGFDDAWVVANGVGEVGERLA